MKLLAVPAALLLALTPATGAAAQQAAYAENIALPTGSLPEGVANGPDGTLFAGARSDGSIYQADVRTGEGEVVVEGRDGYAAVGMSYDRFADLLWVAGGGPGAQRGLGTVTAYDGTTLERVYERVVPAAGFLNDLVVTRDAVYVTDSFDASLVVVPLEDRRPAGEPRELPLTGEYVQPQGFGANGITTAPSGDDLVLVSGGVLYRVDPTTGAATVLEVEGGELSGGDGLVREGAKLFVVNGQGGDEAVQLRFTNGGETLQVVRVLTDEDLDRPTTGVLYRGGLYLVNGRFETLAEDPDAPVSISRVELRR